MNFIWELLSDVVNQAWGEGMRHRPYLSILFYLSILACCFFGSTGELTLLSAEGKVIETFEAGPLKTTQKKVVKVQTHFEWNLENPCPCDGESAPCIKTFLNKDLPNEESRDVQIYNEMDDNSEKYQGGNLVPATIEQSSVRILTVPFCKQVKSNQ